MFFLLFYFVTLLLAHLCFLSEMYSANILSRQESFQHWQLSVVSTLTTSSTIAFPWWKILLIVYIGVINIVSLCVLVG